MSSEWNWKSVSFQIVHVWIACKIYAVIGVCSNRSISGYRIKLISHFSHIGLNFGSDTLKLPITYASETRECFVMSITTGRLAYSQVIIDMTS